MLADKLAFHRLKTSINTIPNFFEIIKTIYIKRIAIITEIALIKNSLIISNSYQNEWNLNSNLVLCDKNSYEKLSLRFKNDFPIFVKAINFTTLPLFDHQNFLKILNEIQNKNESTLDLK